MLTLALAFLILSQAPPDRPTAATVSGVILDPAGTPVNGARIVSVLAPGCDATSAADGRFSLECAAEADTLQISAPGFRPIDVSLTTGPQNGALRVIVEPAPHTEVVVVTATRAETQTTSRASPVSVLTAVDLAHAPPVPLDDVLRSVPGFSLFRRSSSRVSNPTTQGATLRGLGASGASRALVLADGLPLNDPFGGWVSWNRVPVASVERVEVVRGGASDLYGPDALAGVVQLLTVKAPSPTLRAEVSGGMRGTARASFFGGIAHRRWQLTLAGEVATTDGYVIVSEAERGPVDTEAGGRYATARAAVGRAGEAGHVGVNLSAFAEDRENGTPLQINDTRSWQASLDSGGPAGAGRWRARAHTSGQTYRQVFSAIAASRASELLTSRQRVPASEHGLSAEWSRPGARLDLLIGGDVRETTATNHEQGFFPDGRLRTPTSTAAFQRSSGVFAHTTVRARDDLTLALGARGDLRERDRSGGLSDADSKVSPRVSAAWTASPSVIVRASAAWSYRAPTLNERYRGFRVGSVLTLPNANLRSESLRTIEGGLFLLHRDGSLRLTVFRGDLDDGVANVTLSVTPELITRRRENVGGIRVRGVELEEEWRPHASATITAAAALLDSRFADDPALDGLRVPQVPRWQASAGLQWLAPWEVRLGAQLRAFGGQFDDDRNTLMLSRGAVVDVTAVRRIASRVSVFASIENLTDTRYDVGRTPVRTLGQPLSVYGGLRIERPR